LIAATSRIVCSIWRPFQRGASKPANTSTV